jgi:hypothetical protein
MRKAPLFPLVAAPYWRVDPLQLCIIIRSIVVCVLSLRLAARS